MKIAFCAAEAVPFAKTGGLGDVCGALPLALEKLGVDVTMFLPRYKIIDVKRHQLRKVSPSVWRGRAGKNISVFFIDHETFFNRDGLYGYDDEGFSDNLERFQYFCAQILETIQGQRLECDILHCHDWHTALLPVYLRERAARHRLSRMKSVLTIHNCAFQGMFEKGLYPVLGLREDLFSPKGLEFFGRINLLKGGIIFSDAVTTVSPQYAREILTKSSGCGLNGVLRSHPQEIRGILNGVDYQIWNPSTDALIAQRYTIQTAAAAKKANKAALQKRCQLPVKDNAPLLGFVGRLTDQKGIDLILDILGHLEKSGVQIVIQGVGEERFERALKTIAETRPAQIAVNVHFEEELAHQIYAGSDIFLMPSRFEPCGLSQLISLRYGTIPVVSKTGGLVDTVIPFGADPGSGNGFMFEPYSKAAFLTAVRKAVQVYQQQVWGRLLNNAMKADFSWDNSARAYEQLYRHCSGGN